MNTTLSILILILLYEPHDSPGWRIASFICSHLHDMENISMQAVTEACFCSASSMTKVFKRCGASTWSQFRERLIRSAKTREIQLEEKFAGLSENDLLFQIRNLSGSDFDSARLTHECRKFADSLERLKKMNLFGSAFPVSLSLSFIEDLCLLGIEVLPFLSNSSGEARFCSGQFNCAVTFSGRWLEEKPETFHELKALSNPFSVISTRKAVVDEAEFGILMPYAVSVEFENCIYLLILDLILFYLVQNRIPAGRH